jgi:hypothetical protein
LGKKLHNEFLHKDFGFGKDEFISLPKKLRDYEGMTEIIKEFGRVKKENRQQSNEV